MKFEFPSLGDDTWIRRAYWQLLLPPEEHLVVSPARIDRGIRLGLEPLLLRPAARARVKRTWSPGSDCANPGSTPAPAGMNNYLFSSLGRIGPCEIVTAGRSTIVFVVVRHCLAGRACC